MGSHFYSLFSPLKVDDNGKDWPWSNNPGGNCNECLGDKVCGQEICVASNKDNLARTFKSVCNFLEKFHDAKDIRTFHVGLGKCSGLFGEGSMHFRIIFFNTAIRTFIFMPSQNSNTFLHSSKLISYQFVR